MSPDDLDDPAETSRPPDAPALKEWEKVASDEVLAPPLSLLAGIGLGLLLVLVGFGLSLVLQSRWVLAGISLIAVLTLFFRRTRAIFPGYLIAGVVGLGYLFFFHREMLAL